MSQTDHILTDQQRTFIEAQRMFFVATAPSNRDGHVNVSPKGLDTLRILGPNAVTYVDHVGSGIETVAHVRENGRIVIMLCAFEGPPKILRLHGRGTVIEPQDPEFGTMLERFAPVAYVRAIIKVDVSRISESCGYGVPLFQFAGQRTQLPAWAEKKGDAGLRAYQCDKNGRSIDGLSSLRWIDESQHQGA